MGAGLKSDAYWHENNFLLQLSSPFPLLLQEVGEVITFVHVVCVLAFLCVQLLDGVAVALLGEQQLTQHPPVRLIVLLLQTLQLGKVERSINIGKDDGQRQQARQANALGPRPEGVL